MNAGKPLAIDTSAGAGRIRKGGVGKWVAMGALLFIGAAVLDYGKSELNKSMAAGSWPVTPGFIQDCKVEMQLVSGGEGGDYEEYSAQVKYWYELDGRRFEREYLAYAYTADASRERPEKLCAQLRSTKSVDVRHDPNDPNEAFLGWGPSRKIILILYLGVWIVLISCLPMLEQFHWGDGLFEDLRLALLKGGRMAALIMFSGIWIFPVLVEPFYLHGLTVH